jgi:hypothetical protein
VPLDAVAVTGNLTVVNESTAGAVYLGPSSMAQPDVSTIYFKKVQVVANNVTDLLSPTGTLSATFMASSGSTDLVLDVTGYYSTSPGGGKFVPMTPVRLLDTRVANGLPAKIPANTPRTFHITGRGVPVEATAITGNLTIVGETGPWAIFLGPSPIAKPGSSNINFVKGDIKANGLTVDLGTGGTLSATYMAGSKDSTQLVLDVSGYFVP